MSAGQSRNSSSAAGNMTTPPEPSASSDRLNSRPSTKASAYQPGGMSGRRSTTECAPRPNEAWRVACLTMNGPVNPSSGPGGTGMPARRSALRVARLSAVSASAARPAPE